MGSNFMFDFDEEALLESRMTAGELVEELGLTVPEIMEAFPRLCKELLEGME